MTAAPDIIPAEDIPMPTAPARMSAYDNQSGAEGAAARFTLA
jgi:hypothetical protein